MPTNAKPIVGNWYRDQEDGLLEVVAIDEDEETVEVQFFGGEVTEFSLDTWYEMELEGAPAPEDWSGPFDDLEREDVTDSGEAMRPEDWGGPWDELDRES